MKENDAGAAPGPSGLSGTELATTRTALASERTLMAWIRTALSMIGAGFAIYKVLHGLEEASAIRLRRAESPRNLGLFLGVLGTASLVAGLVEHAALARRLRRTPWRTGPAFVVACAVVALGLWVVLGLAVGTGPF